MSNGMHHGSNGVFVGQEADVEVAWLFGGLAWKEESDHRVLYG